MYQPPLVINEYLYLTLPTHAVGNVLNQHLPIVRTPRGDEEPAPSE